MTSGFGDERVAGLRPFALERFFAKHEFNVRWTLCASDCQTMRITELLDLAGPESLRLWETASLGYTQSEGHPRLRELISAGYRQGRPDEVLTVVPVEGIYLALRALLEPGDEVVVPWPAYQSLAEVALGVGAKVRCWEPDFSKAPTDPEFFSLETLAELMSPRTKLVVTNFPHNPTGALVSRAQWATLLEMVANHNAWLLSDEMYRGLEFEPDEARLPAAYESDYRRTVSLCGLSKRHGLPGLRLGWLATRDQGLMHRIRCLKDYTTICGVGPGELLGMIGLENEDALTERSMSFIRNGISAWSDVAREFARYIDWVEPSAGPISFPRLKSDEFDATWLCTKLRDDSEVLILPGQVYGDAYRGRFRIAFGRGDAAQAVEAFRHGFAELAAHL